MVKFKKLFLCPECDSKFEDLLEYENHYLSYHMPDSIEEEGFCCSVCGRMYETKEDALFCENDHPLFEFEKVRQKELVDTLHNIAKEQKIMPLQEYDTK